MRRTSALIVGGGPAGAAAAITFARANYDHLLIERSRETGDALCGGFLSWRTLETLRTLGMDGAMLNPADVARVRLFAAAHRAETRLPRPAKAVSRRRLDALLLDRATALGARIERGIAAKAFEDGIRTDEGAMIDADSVLLATGKHDLRGLVRPGPARGDDPVLGLRLRLASSPPLTRLVGDAIELHLFDGGYAGLVLQEDGSANLCMAVRRSRLSVAGDPLRLIALLSDENPTLGERLVGLDSGTPIDAVANVPYGWRARQTLPGLFRLGDQAGVIPSLAGEGMGIALATGISAAQAVMAGRSASEWQARCAAALARPFAIASAVKAAVERPRAGRALVVGAHWAPWAVSAIARLTRVDDLRL